MQHSDAGDQFQPFISCGDKSNFHESSKHSTLFTL